MNSKNRSQSCAAGGLREVDFLRGGVDAALVSRSAASPPRYPALLLHFPQPFLMFPQRI